MAVKETGFQTELVKAFDKAGHHCFKAAHRDKVGVVDLYLRTKKGAIWIECKWLTVDPTFRYRTIGPTRPQWSFMRKELAAGGFACLIIGYRRRKAAGHDDHGLFICDPNAKDIRVTKEWFSDTTHPGHILKVRGADWAGTTLAERIYRMGMGASPWMGESVSYGS